jgi:hypothetical protein
LIAGRRNCINLSFKNILSGYRKSNLVAGENGEVYSELKRLRQLIQKPYDIALKPLQPNQPLRVLIFNCSESAISWEYLALHHIPIESYTALFRKQHGYDIRVNQPKCIEAVYAIDQIVIDDEILHELNNRYMMNEYERAQRWCVLCRGIGYIMALPAEKEPIENGIPAPVYRLRCNYHPQDQNNHNSNRKKPNIVGASK